MNKLICFIIVLCMFVMVMVVGGGYNEYIVVVLINMDDKVFFQCGVQIFVNNCLGCYFVQYMCYEWVFEDLEIFLDIMMVNLMFIMDCIGEVMYFVIFKDLLKKWFGMVLSDLMLIVCVCGVDWVYFYLINFYFDELCLWNVNNYVFLDVGMFYVLLCMEEELGEKVFKLLMVDLINYMVYMVELV